MASIQKIVPSLWFDMNAEEAMQYYTSVFKDSRIVSIERYPDESLDEHFIGMSGKVINGIFELNGVRFSCLDGGPLFRFSEAVSFTVMCKDQEEIDYFWERLSHTPESEQCGWCKDKYGISWQIIPENIAELVLKSDAALHMLMGMKKIIIAKFESAKNAEPIVNVTP